ncbi:MAG: TetR/AcrR family transcriptional regulator [Actinocrinis sp.]
MPSDAADTADTAARPGRAHYHHGDLANALTSAGVALAREGGPDAVVLREAARRVGVSPTAAYRHFAGHEELRHAVKLRAQALLAEAMEAGISAGPRFDDPAGEAQRRMGAIGWAYLHFALQEPGLFRTAFCFTNDTKQDDVKHIAPGDAPKDRRDGAADKVAAWPSGIENFLQHKAFQILRENLDLLVDTGVLSPALRPLAEFPAWSSVHGLATLLLDGPLDVDDPDLLHAVAGKVLDGVMHGLLHDPAQGPGSVPPTD